MTNNTPAPPAIQSTSPRFALPRLFVGLRGDGKLNLPNELLAGVTLAALMIPLNIGYAQVAGLPPIVGLYTAIIPSVLWAIFATSRNLIASPDAPIAALIGSLLAGLAVPGDERYAQLAFAQALMCAVFFFLFWFFRLGFLANFLSKAVLVGFISGLGIEVMLSQIEKIMGVSIDVEGFFRELAATLLATTGIVFSLLTVPLSLAASQFGSRLLRIHLRDKIRTASTIDHRVWSLPFIRHYPLRRQLK